jgi:hypothetical protein
MVVVLVVVVVVFVIVVVFVVVVSAGALPDCNSRHGIERIHGASRLG